MTHLIRITSYGQNNPVPTPETAELTPEQRREYTFVLMQDNGDDMLISEMAARDVSPLIEHMAVGDVYHFLGTNLP